MEFRRFQDLPRFMRTAAVRPYYDCLRRHRLALICKRWMDFALSSVLLIATAPVFLVLAILIKWDSKGPVFYRQERITQYGRTFLICKFRTMCVDADRKGTLVTTAGDARVTKIGKKLRGCRLDELPQLYNIWKGEMSFVGTRPEVFRYVKQYRPEMFATLLLPAGVTSEASICFKDEEKLLSGGGDTDKLYVEQVLPEKMKYNLRDIREYGFFKELRTMLRTVGVFVTRRDPACREVPLLPTQGPSERSEDLKGPCSIICDKEGSGCSRPIKGDLT